MYVSFEIVFEKIWKALKFKYNEEYWSIVEYLEEKLIDRWKTRIVKCFINKMLSFDNIITFRAEEDHVKLKRALKTFIEDLKKVINVIELLLKNERSKYLLAYEDAKARISINCNIYALKHFQTFISFYVLKLIRKQFDKSLKADNNVEILSFCTENYQ